MMEGISQEAASVAGHFGLGKLTVCYDENHITIDGSTAISFDGEDHVARMLANGWHVQRVEDSEDLDALEAAIAAARAETERPSFIAIRSHIAYPAPNATDTSGSHGAPLGEAEVRATKQVMGFDPDRHFWVDDSVLRAHVDARGRRGGPERVAGAHGRAGAPPTRTWRRTGTAPGRAGCARAGARRCRSSRRANSSPGARPGRRRWPPSRRSRRR